jgi:hypothetical protein
MSHGSIAHPRLDELIAELASARRDLLQAVDECPAAVHHEQSREDGWTLSQILEHVAVVEDGAGRLINRLVKNAREQGVEETNTESVLHTLDKFGLPIPTRRFRAPDFTTPQEGISIDQSLERLQQSRERLLKVVESARGISLSTVSAPHPAVGDIDGYGWLLATAQHERRHAYQIRQLSNTGQRA